MEVAGQEDNKVKRLKQKHYIKMFLLKILLIIFIFGIIFYFVFGITSVKGNDMSSYLNDGDIALYFRIQKKFIVGDIVVFSVDTHQQISRIVATEGDEVNISKEGALIINGNVQQEEIFYPTFYEGNNIRFPYVVPQNCIFVLNDHRTNANDSREYGAIPLTDIRGKLISVVRVRIH